MDLIVVTSPMGWIALIAMYSIGFVMGSLITQLKKSEHPGMAWAVVFIGGLIFGGLIRYTTNIDKVEFKVNVEQVGQLAPTSSSEDRFNAILTDAKHGLSNYGDDNLDVAVAFAGNDIDDATPRSHR